MRCHCLPTAYVKLIGLFEFPVGPQIDAVARNVDRARVLPFNPRTGMSSKRRRGLFVAPSSRQIAPPVAPPRY